jgi:hypothetical protein
MGYEWTLLTADERNIVLTLMRHQRDGLTLSGFAALPGGLGFTPDPAARAHLWRLGYVLEGLNVGDEPDDARLELLDRGWRWIEETAAREDVTRLFPDADETERIAWGILHDAAAHAKAHGTSLVQIAWEAEQERELEREQSGT